jgi:homoserine dehydrogenase
VGGGVYRRLAALPELFSVLAVGTRNFEQAVDGGVPVKVLTHNLEALVAEPVDVVVELLGGTEPAQTLITAALRRGRNVVTANKALLADDLIRLQRLASNNAMLRYSAAVGGVMPALETIRRARKSPLSSISGVLNGTTNFILDEIANGCDFSEALLAAQQNGYAERDPKLDLDGTDAAQKLLLIARAAFDIDLPLGSIEKHGIENLEPKKIREAKNYGRITLLVAECRRESRCFVASVSPIELPLDHPLACATGVENRLLIESQNGNSWEIGGRGAGRWPTTEAVLSDLFDLRRDLINAAEEEEECVA